MKETGKCRPAGQSHKILIITNVMYRACWCLKARQVLPLELPLFHFYQTEYFFPWHYTIKFHFWFQYSSGFIIESLFLSFFSHIFLNWNNKTRSCMLKVTRPFYYDLFIVLGNFWRICSFEFLFFCHKPHSSSISDKLREILWGQVTRKGASFFTIFWIVYAFTTFFLW